MLNLNIATYSSDSTVLKKTDFLDEKTVEKIKTIITQLLEENEAILKAIQKKHTKNPTKDSNSKSSVPDETKN